MAQPKIYTRLTRNSAGVATFSNLWLGPDHILIVSSTGFSESYARVMLRDIKAVFITRTDRRAWWSFGWGIPTVIAGFRMVADLVAHERPIASAILFGIAAVGFVWNALLGEGCRVYIMTGVQTARLPGLVRLKKTRRVIARLQPLIAAAQADLSPILAPADADRGPPVERAGQAATPPITDAGSP